jgi:hypothetical protein
LGQVLIRLVAWQRPVGDERDDRGARVGNAARAAARDSHRGVDLVGVQRDPIAGARTGAKERVRAMHVRECDEGDPLCDGEHHRGDGDRTRDAAAALT